MHALATLMWQLMGMGRKFLMSYKASPAQRTANIRYLRDEENGERYRWDKSASIYGSYPKPTTETVVDRDLVAYEQEQAARHERRRVRRTIALEAVLVWISIAGYILMAETTGIIQLVCGLVVGTGAFILAIAHPIYNEVTREMRE